MSIFPDQDQTQQLRTVLDWVRFTASQMERSGCFYGHGFVAPWDEARFLVLRTLQLDWDIADACLGAVLLEDEKVALHEQIEKRCVEKIPTSYLLNEAWFCGEPFYVNDNVLVPRSPIAELIDQRFKPWLTDEPTRVLDLCTGSGCIGIAIAHAFPQAVVDLSDLSEQAVEIATENVSAKDLEYQVQVFQGDLFDALPDERYDLIVSNPPYVDQEDLDDMPQEFHHEPRMGLEAGEDGLAIVHRILATAPEFLSEQGWLVCEVGNSAVALMEAYPDLNLQWPDFKQGGHGVFIVSAKALIEYFEHH